MTEYLRRRLPLSEGVFTLRVHVTCGRGREWKPRCVDTARNGKRHAGEFRFLQPLPTPLPTQHSSHFDQLQFLCPLSCSHSCGKVYLKILNGHLDLNS